MKWKSRQNFVVIAVDALDSGQLLCVAWCLEHFEKILVEPEGFVVEIVAGISDQSFKFNYKN